MRRPRLFVLIVEAGFSLASEPAYCRRATRALLRIRWVGTLVLIGTPSPGFFTSVDSKGRYGSGRQLAREPSRVTTGGRKSGERVTLRRRDQGGSAETETSGVCHPRGP